MEPLEPYEKRLEMAAMHDDVLQRINNAIERGSYVETCWYAYACFENRFDRIISKIAQGCPKAPRAENARPTGITTKIECLIRLSKREYPLVKDVKPDTLRSVKRWCKERNKLVHQLVTLDQYDDVDSQFQKLAEESADLVDLVYQIGAIVRDNYYDADSIIPIDNDNAKKCRRETCCASLQRESGE
ncbi:MAG: hypothetical protein HFJ75_05020 [Eggerthellaceae bacterium]|nr:hypothetical protein [Eggerthellaceae bacterium]